MYFNQSIEIEKLHFMIAAYLSMMLVAVVGFVVSKVARRKLTRKDDLFLYGFGALFFIVFFKFGTAINDLLLRAFVSHDDQIMVAVMTVCAGFFAFGLKLQNQVLYGTIEVWFGMVSAFGITLWSSSNNGLFSKFVTLVGCAYVISRGLSNRRERMQKLAS